MPRGGSRGFNPGQTYQDKLKSLPPEEAERVDSERRAKMSTGLKKTLAIKRIINSLLKAEVEPNSYQRDVLNAFGYDIKVCGVPTAAVMILCNMVARAAAGDTKAAEFVFSYGHIPNMDQSIKLDQIKALKEAKAKDTEGKNTIIIDV